MNQKQLKTVIREFLSSDKSSPVIENKYTDVFLEKRQEYINNLLKNKRQLVKRYGKDAEKVLTGRATKQAKKYKEDMKQQDIKELVRKSLMKEMADSNIQTSVQNIIDSSKYDKSDFKVTSKDPNEIQLRYQYWARLPEDLRSSLEQNFNVEEYELDDEDTLTQYSYTITSKIEETIDSKKFIAEREENPEDVIKMDVPLFIRMLEYAREDASNDVDLHDVTEKANKLGKERGILSMEDYEEIVGAAEEVKEVEGSITAPEWNSMDVKSKIKLLRYHFPKLSLKFADWKWEDLTPMIKNKLTGKVVKEGMGNEVGDKVYFKGDMGEKYPSSQGYYGIIEDTTPARNYNMMATYDVVVYDKNDNEIRTITTDFTNLTTKKVNEASDYIKRRKSQDDYAVNKKDKPKKSYNPTPSGKTDYMKRREKELAEERFKKGTDIGKKGPGFKKIEKSAAKKYGSEEAGKRVAGAVLQKILAKKGK